MKAVNCFGLPDLGLGVGLRTVHFDHITSQWPKVDWFEVVSENFMDTGGRPLHVLDRIAERYPIVMHGVSMSIGSTDPIDFDYLTKLKSLSERIHAKWVSDHVCWTGVLGNYGHDLFPLPYTEESLAHIVARIGIVQDVLERPLILENPTTYASFADSTMSEEHFLCRMLIDANCGLLLDVNNLYINVRNHGGDPYEYLHAIPTDRVVQFHLAGHTDHGTHCIDTHNVSVVNEVWELYSAAVERFGNRSTLLEWDAEIPPFEKVHEEVLKADRFRAKPYQIAIVH